jgi:quercetin dioxygenase-like cupin family protein
MSASEKKPNYTVKHVEVVAKGADVVARVFTLAPGDAIPWHYHSESNDHYFVLAGKLSVDTRDPDETYTLSVGERHTIKPGTKHLISNRSDAETRFLLVQGVGKYDWLKAQF